ncbi:hypothetical protein PENTCL1PPCAC_30396 [Pristionchus entomophagus]|uniref:Saposin B-type domain-containing protein n=1 Tax=Pristionchus entomophagus TaxID=358040 RepID=A0AAV5UNQ8_9BILA|nr:hypothetical protein PENTCL1PPCAC_13992 [Pristionchus entomophagus]GMT08222.1 hypothetical protein PENTCL1PPCAC_30396 [Pristionchus entomophagus]
MRSTIVLLALVVTISASALFRQPMHQSEQQLVKEATKLHQKPKSWYIKPYYHTFVETGKSEVLDGMFCKICKDIIDGAENFGEQTAMDYLKEATKEMCDELPFANLQKDCFDYFVGIAQDLIDLINSNASGEQACTAMTLC